MAKSQVLEVLGEPPHKGTELGGDRQEYWEYGHVSSVFAPVPDNRGHVVYFDKQAEGCQHQRTDAERATTTPNNGLKLTAERWQAGRAAAASSSVRQTLTAHRGLADGRAAVIEG